MSDPLFGSVDFHLLGFLLCAVLIDLLFRWIAFSRVESVAVDMAIFSCLYSAIKMLEENEAASGQAWGYRFFFGLGILVCLIALHLWLRLQLEATITDVFDKVQHDSARAKQRDFVSAQRVIATYAIDVALVERKKGKRDRRQRIADSINTIIAALKKPDDVSRNKSFDLIQGSFLIETNIRYWMMFVFFLGALISIFIPVIKF